jgi:hypothetical protein
MAQHAAETRSRDEHERPPRPETIVVHGSGVAVDRVPYELPQVEARRRFGGMDAVAVLGGGAAGLGTAALLGALVAALLQAAGQLGAGQPSDAAVVGALVAAVVVVALSAFVAGWVAGRMARFDGLRNGLLAGVLLAVLLALVGAAGGYGGQELASPDVTGRDAWLSWALVAAAVAAVVVLVLAAVAGRLGTRWHRAVDDLMLGTRAGAVPVPGRGDREVAR